jgi:hypothetical protein
VCLTCRLKAASIFNSLLVAVGALGTQTKALWLDRPVAHVDVFRPAMNQGRSFFVSAVNDVDLTCSSSEEEILLLVCIAFERLVLT